jgi:hypothetical protein
MPGRPPKLNAAQLAQLAGILTRSPAEYNYSREARTTARVAELRDASKVTDTEVEAMPHNPGC